MNYRFAYSVGFHPWEDADWNSTLSMAKNIREKAVLWHMFGVYADPLKGMKEIYKLDSKSELIDLLLVRSINIAEKKLLPNLSYEDMYAYDGADYQDTTLKIYDSSRSFSAFDKDNPLRKKGDINFYVPSTAYGYIEIIHNLLIHFINDRIIGRAIYKFR